MNGRLLRGTFPTDEKLTLEARGAHHPLNHTPTVRLVYQGERDWLQMNLFNEAQVSFLLTDYDQDTGDSYYRVCAAKPVFCHAEH